MDDSDRLTAADVRLMQALAQRLVAVRPELVNSDASVGELAWNRGKGHAAAGGSRRRRLWFSGAELLAWGWAQLPRRVRRNDGSVQDVTSACLAYQVHPDAAALVDEVIGWYDGVADGIERTVVAQAADEFALGRWAAHGYADPHVLVEAPDGTMAASTIMWLDEANGTAAFEPVGTHPDYRRRGPGRAMLLHGMRLARQAGARHMTVACLGASGRPAARELYCSVGFRQFSRDVPLVRGVVQGAAAYVLEPVPCESARQPIGVTTNRYSG